MKKLKKIFFAFWPLILPQILSGAFTMLMLDYPNKGSTMYYSLCFMGGQIVGVIITITLLVCFDRYWRTQK